MEILYSTRCCESVNKETTSSHCLGREGVVFGTSQKTCHHCFVMASGDRLTQMQVLHAYVFTSGVLCGEKNSAICVK